MTDVLSRPKLDVAFRLAGRAVPLDHGYVLFGAMSRVLGDLHGADWLAVHPVRGIPRPDGMLALHWKRGELRVRVEPGDIPRVLPLAGQSLDLDGHVVHVGVSRVYALRPSPVLTSRIVVIKGCTDPVSFEHAVRRQLEALGVAARVEVGRRRVITVDGDVVVGFGVTLRDLTDEGSLAVQYAGLGGRQRFGCGVFVARRVFDV